MNIFLTIAALSVALAIQWQHYFLHSSLVKFLGSCFPLVQYCSKWVSGHSCSSLVRASHMQELIIGLCLCNLFIGIGWSLLLWSIMAPFPTSHANDIYICVAGEIRYSNKQSERLRILVMFYISQHKPWFVLAQKYAAAYQQEADHCQTTAWAFNSAAASLKRTHTSCPTEAFLWNEILKWLEHLLWH